MVLHAWDGNRLLRRAFVASLTLHVLLAVFLPTWMRAQSQGLQAVESISFAHVVHVQIMRPATHALPAVVPNAKMQARVASFARVKPELSVTRPKAHVRPRAQNGPAGPIAAAPKHLLQHRPAPLYAQAATTSVPISTSQSTAAQTPQPQSTVEDRPAGGSANANRGGVLPFGAQQDPVLDPGVLGKLQSVSAHVTLLVTVGEDGKTKRVEFQPPLDAQTERAIETILASANWDAAVCGGGVSCQGVATIKL